MFYTDTLWYIILEIVIKFWTFFEKVIWRRHYYYQKIYDRRHCPLQYNNHGDVLNGRQPRQPNFEIQHYSRHLIRLTGRYREWWIAVIPAFNAETYGDIAYNIIYFDISLILIIIDLTSCTSPAPLLRNARIIKYCVFEDDTLVKGSRDLHYNTRKETRDLGIILNFREKNHSLHRYQLIITWRQ